VPANHGWHSLPVKRLVRLTKCPGHRRREEPLHGHNPFSSCRAVALPAVGQLEWHSARRPRHGSESSRQPGTAAYCHPQAAALTTKRCSPHTKVAPRSTGRSTPLAARVCVWTRPPSLQQRRRNTKNNAAKAYCHSCCLAHGRSAVARSAAAQATALLPWKDGPRCMPRLAVSDATRRRRQPARATAEERWHPHLSLASRTATAAPARCRSPAALRPATPPPMTTTSKPGVEVRTGVHGCGVGCVGGGGGEAGGRGKGSIL
jgi:hypothetical protein